MLLYCSERVRRIVVHPTTRKLLKRAYKELLKERLTRYQTQVRGQSDKRSTTTPLSHRACLQIFPPTWLCAGLRRFYDYADVLVRNVIPGKPPL